MAGIYLHIPFCKQACHYCDFHFSTQLGARPQMLKAILQEIGLQQGYLGKEPVSSIYFGGGTPSLLDSSEISTLLTAICDLYEVDQNAEITLEANPDDLSEKKLAMLRKAGVNRLSIGIQSFHDPHLKFMNRAHTASEALDCLSIAENIGFDDLSIDLIYGLPADDHRIWEEDIRQALQLPINHISAYCLTIEPNTVFGNWLGKKKIRPIEEEFSATQFVLLCETLARQGFEQYEISNFCLPGHYSRHNSAYWQQKKYLGIGPSAHSFDGIDRQFNIAHNQKYIKSLAELTIPCTIEHLTAVQRANEYLLTTIRTKWGSSMQKLEAIYPGWTQHFGKPIHALLEKKLLDKKEDVLLLTDNGKLVADEITLQLFLDE
ncbi:MAG: radical SAM family heme chaperone HemW [Cyclobacteriaceae bacterium]